MMRVFVPAEAVLGLLSWAREHVEECCAGEEEGIAFRAWSGTAAGRKLGLQWDLPFFKIHFIKYEDTTSLQVPGHSPRVLLITINYTSDLQPSFCTESHLSDLP